MDKQTKYDGGLMAFKKTRFSIALSFAVLVIFMVFSVSALNTDEQKITSLVSAEIAKSGAEEKIPVIIIMKEQSPLSKPLNRAESIASMKSFAEAHQANILQALKQEEKLGNVKGIKRFWSVNAIAVKATPSVIEQIAKRSDVERIEPDVPVRALSEYEGEHVLSNPFTEFVNPQPMEEVLPKDIMRDHPYAYTAWGVDWVEAPQLWERGINGSGVNVSIIDTGIAPHPDIADRIVAFKDFVKNIPYNGSKAWYSGKGAGLNNTLQRNFTLSSSASSIELEFYGKYAMGVSYNVSYNYTTQQYTYLDFGYVQVSTDGVNWTTLATYKGVSDGYLKETVDLSAYRGQTVLIRFLYSTSNISYYNKGWYLDDIKIKEDGAVTFFDGGEGGTGSWVVNGWTIKDNTVFWPTGTMFYSGSGNHLRNSLERTFDFSGLSTVTLKFVTRYHTESCCDRGRVQVSTDNGSSWTTLATYNGYSDYTNITLNLNSYAGRSNVKLRFYYYTDYCVAYEGWYVDEIRIPELGFYDNGESLANWNASGWRVVGPDTPYDDGGHGTHVAGTVAGNGKMGINTGVAPGANLMGAKVLGDGGGRSSDIIQGVEWSVENHADVVSLSLGLLPLDVRGDSGILNQSETAVENITVFTNPFESSPFKTISPDAFQPTSIFGGVGAYTNNSVWQMHMHSTAFLQRTINLSNVSTATLNFRTHYHLNYGYVQVSTDGATWTTLDTYTGSSHHVGNQWWRNISLDLTPYAGSNVTLRFYHPPYYHDLWQVDDISVPEIGFYDDVESGNTGWTASGWRIVTSPEPVDITNLNITLTTPDGTPVTGNPVNWWYWAGELPSNVWFYKYTGDNPLQPGMWNLTITSNYSRPVYYYYFLLVTYPSDGSDATSQALNRAADLGVVPVVAAGNEGDLGLYSIDAPGASGKAITVGATDYHMDYIADFSSRGPVGFGANKTIKPDVVAPGVDITSLDTGNGYRSMSGTSMATPHVAGTVALMLQRNSSLTPAQVKNILMNSSVDLGAPGRDNTYGAGRISAYAAVSNASSEPLPPTVEQRSRIHELFAGATVDDVYVKPFIRDAVGDADPSVDIQSVEANAYSYFNYVRFGILTSGRVNLSTSEFYLDLDTDKNSATGAAINDIGADYRIKLNASGGGLYRMNGSQEEFVQYVYPHASDGYVYTDLYLPSIGQTYSNVSFFGVARTNTDTAPDTGHGVFPYADIPIRMVGISWNDETGAPQAGTNITFRVQIYKGYPYYNYTTLFNSTVQTNSSGMAVADYMANQTELYETYHVDIWDDKGNHIHDHVYADAYVPHYYQPQYPFMIPRWIDYYAVRNSTLPVKLTMVTPDWQPYNNNVTLVFGFGHSVSAYLTPTNGTIEYDLDLANTSIDELYSYIPVYVLNGTRYSYDYSEYVGHIHIRHPNFSRVNLNPEVYSAAPDEKLDFLVETYNPYFEVPTSKRLEGIAYWIREVDVKALGEKVSPAVLVKLNEMRESSEQGEYKDLLSREEKDELRRALNDIKNIGINYSTFEVTTDATGIARFNVTVPQAEQKVYFGYVEVGYDDSTGQDWDDSFVFVKSPDWEHHPRASPESFYDLWLQVNWNAHKVGDEWVPDDNFTVNLWLRKYNSSTGWQDIAGEPVHLYTTTRETKTVITDVNGSASVNFTAPAVDIRNSTWDERSVQVWGITGLLQKGIAVADSDWSYLRIPYEQEYNRTPVTLSISNGNLNVQVEYQNSTGHPVTNVPSVLDVQKSPYYWSSVGDLLSEYVKSSTSTHIRTLPLSGYGTYNARVASEYRCKGCHFAGSMHARITYHPFNISTEMLPRYPRNITRPVTVTVKDKNGTPMQGVSVYIIENSNYWWYGYEGGGYASYASSVQQVPHPPSPPSSGGGGGGINSSLLWGHVDVNKTDASGQATLMLKTPDVNNAWVYYRIGGATDNLSMPYIKSGYFQVRVTNKSDLVPVINMPSVVEAGKQTNITGKVYNYGDIPSNDSVLSLYVDSVLLTNISIDVIQPDGNYTTFNQPWTPASPGSYEIKAVADATDTNDEANEYDNTVSRSVTASLPDLVPSINMPSGAQLGSTLNISVKVRNIGGITTGASALLIQINNAEFNSGSIPPILPGGEYTISVPWTPSSIGNYTVKVISDALGTVNELNELNNITTQRVEIFTLPDLIVSLSVPSELRVNTTVNISATVRNLGSLSSNQTNLSIYEGTTLLQNISVSPLNAGDSREYNVSWTPATPGHKEIRAIIDPEDTTQESNEGNNIVIKHSSAKFTDLAVRIQSRNVVIQNSTETIRVIVRNKGNMASEPSRIRVYVNSTPEEIINKSVPSIAPGAFRIFSASWNATEEGVHTIHAYLDDLSNTDVNPTNDNATRTITVKGYNVTIWYMWYPSYPVYEDRHLYIGAYVDTDYAGTVNASISFDRPGLNVSMPNKTFTMRDRTYNYIWWRVKAEDVGKYNATITVSAFNKTSMINTTHSKTSQIRRWWGMQNYTYHPHGPINVIAQTVIVKDMNWTMLNDSQLGTLSYRVFNVTEIEEPSRYWWRPPKPNRSLTIDISAGAEGRLLLGLEYLVGYPHGCPEQTMSPTIAAKRVEQYYLKRGVLTPALNETLYQKVKHGVARMSPNGTANRQQIPGIGNGSGGWAWGLSRPSMFYTVYTHYGMGIIVNNKNYSHLIYMYNISLNESARWIVDHQNLDGSWTGRGYINGNVPMTGFVMMALNQTLPYMNETMYNWTVNALENATTYLLSKQRSDGGWNQSYYCCSRASDAYSTSLAVLGLLHSGNTSDAVSSAIHNGTNWLIANQRADGSWSRYPTSWSYSWYGNLAETTSYAAIALNKSGIPSDNTSIIRGVRYLVGVYQSRGSWGNTRSTAAAVYALTELQVPAQFEKNVTIVIGSVINQTIRLNESNPGATISSLPKPAMLKERIWIPINKSQLNAIGIGNHTINITTTHISGDDVKVLVAVESRQNALKKEALAKVPREYIDPIAENFTLALGLPEGVKDGDTITANATITNKEDTGLYVMILEVPLSSNVTFPNTYPENTTYYIDENGSKVLVQHMYNESENKLYIYPGSDDESQPSVPAGESRSFYFNVTMLGFGEQTMEASVRPMYNDTLMAIANITATVKGYGNITVNTVDANDSAITADVMIGDSLGASVRKLEGNYSLNITKSGYIPVNTSITVAPGSNKTYTAKLTTNVSEPVAVFYETETIALPANVSGVVTKVYNFTVQSNGGKTIIALAIPENHTFLSATVNGDNASAREENGIVYIEAELTGDSQYEVRFKAPLSTFSIQTAGAALNLIGIPVEDTTVTDANSLRSKSGASFVARWNTSTNKYDVFAGLAKDNFLIKGGEGYFVYTPTTREVSFTGKAWGDGSFTVELKEGLNLISVPLKDVTVTDANSLRSKSGASFVARWNTSTNKYDVFAGLAKDNFLIKGGEGYFVYSTMLRNVTFAGEAWSN